MGGGLRYTPPPHFLECPIQPSFLVGVPVPTLVEYLFDKQRATGRTGFVHQAVLDDFANLSGHQVYACGAPIVVDSARHAYVEQRGLPAEEFYADAFTSEADKAS